MRFRMFEKSSAFLAIGVIGAMWFGCGGSSNSDLVSGTPPVDAGDGTSGDEAGTTDDSGTNYDTPVVCTSGTKWLRGDRGSSSMHPGVACIDCHVKNGGPRLSIAGTVYPTAHEPDDCNGVNGGLKVVITDGAGKTQTLSVNSVGNFYSTTAFTKPFTAKVVNGTTERAMTASQTSGDCNSCHTVSGTNDAPGRIMAP